MCIIWAPYVSRPVVTESLLPSSLPICCTYYIPLDIFFSFCVIVLCNGFGLFMFLLMLSKTYNLWTDNHLYLGKKKSNLFSSGESLLSRFLFTKVLYKRADSSQAINWFDRPKHIFQSRGPFGAVSDKRSVGLLICTLISENQGLEKSRSASNLRKISGLANLFFFQFVTWIFFRFTV